MVNDNLAKKDLVAQWAFDTQPVLDRFHLWLEDVEVDWVSGDTKPEFTTRLSFLPGRIERNLAMTAAVTALGTKLFGRFGEGAGKDKAELNEVKKDADAVSAYTMSESLWVMSRLLPENHAIMVCLGEGLMPKAGETPEMGSNPQLGFGRVYARPEVAKWLDSRVTRLLNEDYYGWDEFHQDITENGITIWGAAIDTLENTSRFAKGAETGPMSVLHLFNQPLRIVRPYEGYMGNLFLPRAVEEHAALKSILLSFRTPRSLVLEAIESTYPDLKRDHIHVWTLRGKSRVHRIGHLWEEWKELGVNLVEDGWELPNGMAAFTESGTYAPTYMAGLWKDKKGDDHLLVCDGYAASAEAIQAASLAPMMGLSAFLSVFTSSFKLPYHKEVHVMGLDPVSKDFPDKLSVLLDHRATEEEISRYREMILDALFAGIPAQKPYLLADDFFPHKKWDVLAVSGFMLPDPYSDSSGVEELAPGRYRVTARLAGSDGHKRVTFTLRLLENFEESRLVFNPLLVRFMAGEDYERRAVKISDSGRIRNELQTLCSQALDFIGKHRIRVHFDRIPDEVISPERRKILKKVLSWYKTNHPVWFSWLDIS